MKRRKSKRRYTPPAPPLPLADRLALLGREGVDGALSVIARAHGTGIAEVLGRSRVAHVTEARYEFASALRGSGWSLPRIGKLLGRDHTTIMSGLRSIVDRAEKRARLAKRFAFAMPALPLAEVRAA